MSETALYFTVVILIFIGIAGVLYRRNLIKIVICLNIAVSAVNLLFIVLAYRPEATAPIFTLAPEIGQLKMVLPAPQALILTNIVIGFASTALILTMAVLTYRVNGTLDIRKLKGVEDNE